MRVAAPAKINLHLRVGGVRSDGFHPLLTWMCTVDLFDTLTFIRAGGGATHFSGASAHDWFSLRTDHPGLPVDQGNLVVRVAAAMADTLGRVGEGPTGWRERVSAFLAKRIPAGAGLGGGSSDAAATIKALAAMWKLDWSAQRMGEFAARFGSDVPFFFFGPSSICTGRGEIVVATPPPQLARFAVLALSGIEVSTPKAYAAFDQMGIGSEKAITIQADWVAWSKLPADELLARLVNDLEAPAFSIAPALKKLQTELQKRWNGKIVRMSGSGSTLFTLCDDESAAQDLAQRVGEDLKVRARVVRLAPAGT